MVSCPLVPFLDNLASEKSESILKCRKFGTMAQIHFYVQFFGLCYALYKRDIYVYVQFC